MNRYHRLLYRFCRAITSGLHLAQQDFVCNLLKDRRGRVGTGLAALHQHNDRIFGRLSRKITGKPCVYDLAVLLARRFINAGLRRGRFAAGCSKRGLCLYAAALLNV